MKQNKVTLVSVIITTLNRPELLARTVKGLLKGQAYKNYEIIIIDQSDEPARLLPPEISDEEKIRYFRSSDRGIAAGRNTGISKARGGILLFLDDDVDVGYSPDLIRFHAAAFDIDGVGGAGGRVFSRKPMNNTALPGARVSASGRLMMNFETGSPGFIESTHGANMSFSREAVDAISGFDCRYSGPSLLEETDFCYRIRAAGYRILYEPRAHLRHIIAPAGGCREENPAEFLCWRFHNTALFYSIHMNKFLLPYALAAHSAIGIKHIIQGKINLFEFFKALRAFMKGASSGLRGCSGSAGYLEP